MTAGDLRHICARKFNLTKWLSTALWCGALVVVSSACNSSNFAGSGGRTTKKKAVVGAEQVAQKASNSSGEAVSRSASKFPGGEAVAISFSGDAPFQSVASDAEAWIVTDATITRIDLNQSKGWPKTQWTMPSNSGNRTYVTEIGLLVGRTNNGAAQRGVWLAPRDNPGAAVKIYDPADMGGGSRLSATSFKIGAQPYIGFAYGTNSGSKKFVRIPIDKSKANGVDVSRVESKELSSLGNAFGSLASVWNFAAYSSFMDQTKKTFFLGGGSGRGGWGVNVETLNELSLSALPNWKIGGDPLNASVAKRQICGLTMETSRNMGYALSGDLKGNLVTASGTYTFAHEPVGNLIFGSRGGRNLIVAKQSCVESSGSDCTEANGMCRQFDLNSITVDGIPMGISVGPMSAVGDGRVVGIQRGGTSQVFLLSVKNPNDLSQGLEVQKVADIPGNAYMYNDFTGVTLYSPDQIKVFDFKALKGFKTGIAVRKVAAGWSAQSGVKEDLRGLKLELTCFKQGGTKPPYKDYSAILKSNASLFTLSEDDCSGDIDAMEVKMSSDGTTNNFTRLSTFEIRGGQ